MWKWSKDNKAYGTKQFNSSFIEMSCDQNKIKLKILSDLGVKLHYINLIKVRELGVFLKIKRTDSLW